MIYLKFLIAGAPDFQFQLKEIGEELKKHKIEYVLVNDTDYTSGISKKSLGEFIQPRKKFKSLIKKVKPDIVLVDRRTNFGIYAIKENIPLLVIVRGDIWRESKGVEKNLPLKKRIGQIHRRKFIWEKNFKDASLILPICKYLEKIVNQLYPDKKVEVMYSGIDPSRWHPKEGMKLKHPCIGLVQRASIWGKAQEMFVLQKVLEEMPDVIFYWAGDGQYREKILTVLNKYDNFKWLGNLEYPDKIRQFLTEIDVYALTTGMDMSPLSLLEAQLMKKPVIATNVGGVSEMMKDNETGFLVEKGDSVDLIKKLTLLTNDEQKREVMGNAGRKFVEDNFSWEIIIKKILSVLKKHNIVQIS